MDIDSFRSAVTAVSLVCFLGIVWWAYSKHARKGFEEAAMLPFEEDELPRPGAGSGSSAN